MAIIQQKKSTKKIAGIIRRSEPFSKKNNLNYYDLKVSYDKNVLFKIIGITSPTTIDEITMIQSRRENRKIV